MFCPGSRNLAKINSSASENTGPITFAADGTLFAFFFNGECKWCHSIFCRFVSGSKWWNQLAPPVTIHRKNLLPSCRYLSSSSEVMAFRWPLWSSVNTAGRTDQELSYSPRFQSSPVLHSALFQVFEQLCLQSHACHLERSHPPSFCSVEAVQGRPLRGSSWMLVFPSLKCFTHLRTLLVPMHTLQ